MWLNFKTDDTSGSLGFRVSFEGKITSNTARVVYGLFTGRLRVVTRCLNWYRGPGQKPFGLNCDRLTFLLF